MSEHDHVDDTDTVDVSAVQPVGPDPDLVEKIKAEALIQAGYFIEDDDGAVRASVPLLQRGVLHNMHALHIVNNKHDLTTGSITKFELYQEMLPDAPGVQALAQTPEEQRAQADLMRNLWTYINVGTSGFVQKHSAGQGLVLCEADVARTKVHEETGRREPGTERARFLTADAELILTHYTGPAGAAFIRAARKLDAQLGLVRERQPELATSVAKQVGSMVKQAIESIPHANPRKVTALTAGNEQDTDQGSEDA